MRSPVFVVVAALQISLGLGTVGLAQTTLPLNTGYNHQAFAAYPLVTTNPTPPGNRDSYWLNIASYPPTTPPVDTAWILNTPSGWSPSLPSSHWIGARDTYISAAGTTDDNPSYALFRKCFCLLRGFRDARLDIQVRADDTIQVWLNSQLNKVVTPFLGNWNSAPIPGSTTNQSHFRVGKNCVYVLVEDFRGHTGFDLTGSVSAHGLLPMPAAGVDQSFEPCSCRGEASPTPLGVTGGGSQARSRGDDDQGEIGAIVNIAEERRALRIRPQTKGGTRSSY